MQHSVIHFLFIKSKCRTLYRKYKRSSRQNHSNKKLRNFTSRNLARPSPPLVSLPFPANFPFTPPLSVFSTRNNPAPFTLSSHGDRTFAAARARLWNSLPRSSCTIQTLPTNGLNDNWKGHLFGEPWTRHSVTFNIGRLKRLLTYLLTYAKPATTIVEWSSSKAVFFVLPGLITAGNGLHSINAAERIHRHGRTSHLGISPRMAFQGCASGTPRANQN